MGNKHDAKRRRRSGPIRFKKRIDVGRTKTKTTTTTVEHTEDSIEDILPGPSSSHRKLTSNNTSVLSSNLDASAETHEEIFNSFHYMLLDSRILETILSVVGCCPLCNLRELQFTNDMSKKKGLANCIEIKCLSASCNFYFSTYTSNRVSKNNKCGPDPFDINVRSVIAFREIGKGHTAMETLFGYMNCVPPMAYPTYREMNKHISLCYNNVATDSMLQAVQEIKGDNEEPICDIAVSCDGTWQKRGYSSLNGIVTIISVETGKAIDYNILTKKCDQCTAWESRRDTDAFKEFMSTHENECEINHEGSAGAMEAKGVVSCFSSSVEKYNLRYTQYLGDGDTKSYLEVVKSDPYNGIAINKLECIGHIQKRVGSRLLKMRKDGEFKELYEDSDDDGDVINSKKKKKKKKLIRLTDKNINKLQNYYGIAIRSSTGATVWDLKKSIAAAFYHCCDATSPETRHQFCPKTDSSWCKYQLDRINGTNMYNDKPGIHIKLRDLLKPVFMKLSSDELLSKCLHGKTQNNNECINGIIWKRCPKDIYVGRTTLTMGVASAVISFNDGACGILNIMKEYGLESGEYCLDFCVSRDTKRIKEVDRKSSDQTKKSRKRHRAVRKGFGDKERVSEGLTYGPGMCELLNDT